ncbi:MAG TPA: YihY/virulence factor BrkB family protein [Egibacteraceae bacterium]|jgi:membrane protein|nr:YihY/virulence factor BrkB family protein [Egibacteraceae bacterium]
MTSEISLRGAPVPPEDPTDLTVEDYKAALESTVEEIKRDDVPSLAAGVAFKIFLSLFPALLAGVAVFSIVTTPADLLRLFGYLSGILPAEALSLLEEPLVNLAEGGGASAGGVAAAGVLAGLWAATSAAVTLVKALSRAYDVEESRKFVAQRLVALAITLALFLTIVGLIVLVVAGRPIQEALVPPQFGAVAGVLLGIARVAVAIVLLVMLFAFVYWIGPDRERPEWAWLSPGAVVGVIGWLVLSGAFTLYVRLAGDYDATYGALGGVIVLLLWLQLSMAMLLIGAELNREIERIHDIKAAVAEGAGFALAEPLSEAASQAPDPGASLVLPAVPPPAAGDPPPGLERRSRNGAGGVARVGMAAAAVVRTLAVSRRRRRARTR